MVIAVRFAVDQSPIMREKQKLDKPMVPAKASNTFNVALLSVLVASCNGSAPPPSSKTADPPQNPLSVSEELLSNGKPVEAIQKLSELSWTAPEAMAARRLISDICTRIDIHGPERPRVEVVEVVGTLPHDPTCFTEGLEIDGDTLLESCGLNGSSRIRRVDIRTGAVLQERTLHEKYFGEGTTRFGDATFVLTWNEHTGLVFDTKLTQEVRSFPLEGEGWGLTHDATHLIHSNGSNELRFLDPNTGAIQKSVKVFNGDLPLMNMNELEYVDGELLAVIFPTERIARIDPKSGKVLGWILAEGLLPNQLRYKADVLNGIAYDPAGKRFFLAGKLWPTTYIVRLVPLTR